MSAGLNHYSHWLTFCTSASYVSEKEILVKVRTFSFATPQFLQSYSNVIETISYLFRDYFLKTYSV